MKKWYLSGTKGSIPFPDLTFAGGKSTSRSQRSCCTLRRLRLMLPASAATCSNERAICNSYATCKCDFSRPFVFCLSLKDSLLDGSHATTSPGSTSPRDIGERHAMWYTRRVCCAVCAFVFQSSSCAISRISSIADFLLISVGIR